MATDRDLVVPVGNTDRFYIGGEWVAPSSGATIQVIEAATERPYYSIAEANAVDVGRAVGAARVAFDSGPWPHLHPMERAGYVRAIGAEIAKRGQDIAEIWPRESGVLQSRAVYIGEWARGMVDAFAARAEEYPFEEIVPPTTGGEFGLVVSEPIGVVGAIIPWNSAIGPIVCKVIPALLAGCTVVLKSSPEAPGAGYLFAEAVEAVGLPAGAVNVVTADREASEALVTDPRVDKITFTGSTATGRRIGALCSERVARYTLELGGKSPAVILDDADIESSAMIIAGAECFLSGQVCTSLTRVIVSRHRHDEMAEALAAIFSNVKVGDPFDPEVEMGPLATSRQRDRVESYIRAGVDGGAKLLTGGGRPAGLDRGWFIEPTVFAGVDNSSKIAQEEIFGPVLSVIPADNEDHAIDLANDTIYGLNSSVFTPDVERAREVASRLRAGTVGHNAMRTDVGMSFGGWKQSGVGREGLHGGLAAFLETKSVILNEVPESYR